MFFALLDLRELTELPVVPFDQESEFVVSGELRHVDVDGTFERVLDSADCFGVEPGRFIRFVIGLRFGQPFCRVKPHSEVMRRWADKDWRAVRGLWGH